MNIDKQELLYLEKVKSYIRERLGGYAGDISSLREYIREERKRMWDDFIHDYESPEGVFELVQISQTESRDTQRFERMEKENASLNILMKSPYFARLDFKEDGFDEETIYIGRRSLSDETSSEMLVCDWRSDIAGMFYDSPLGKTSYHSVEGEIPCELLLRRQFKIVDGELIYMFDSDIAVEDEILQSELGKTSDLKMKTIIATIQTEQNAVIRNLGSTLLLVSGVAGSGKTSVALHRLAYLLYKYRKTLTSSNIIIFSPNNVFNSYIADVLPDLGEDKVLQTSFYEFLSGFFPSRNTLSLSEQCERVFAEETGAAEIKLKGSLEFAEKLENYFYNTAVTDVKITNLFLDDAEIRTKEELEYLYFDLYKSFPCAVRVAKIKDGITEYCENEIRQKFIKRYERENSYNGAVSSDNDEFALECEAKWQGELEKMLSDLEKMLLPDIEKAYLNVLRGFSEEYCKDTEQRLARNEIRFEDMLPIAYLMVLSGNIREMHRIKHVVVDEAQDYPPILYMLTAKVFNSAKHTVLGDPDQAFISHLGSIRDIAAYYNLMNTSYVEFNKTYRSTVEINTFLKTIIQTSADTGFFMRHGEAVTFEDAENLGSVVKDLSLKYPSTAVICKTWDEAKTIYEKLSEKGVPVKLIGPEDIVFPGETVVIASYLTKGLEFDAAVVFEDKEDSEEARRVFYVCASRALHKLTIIR